MKTVAISLLAIAIGCLIGVGSTAARFGFLPAAGDAANQSDLPTLTTPTDGSRPVLVIGATEHDFGTMERDAKSHYVFRVRNEGDAPLTLANGGSSCTCTILGGLKDKAAEVEPGGTHDVELEWTAKTGSDEFRQTATILTNDPLQPRIELSVHGRVADSIRVTPPEIIFSKIDTDQPATARLRITSLRAEPIKILGHRFEKRDDREFFHIEISEVAADEINDPDIRHAMDVTLSVARGLPIGPFEQLLKLETNIEGRELIEVPILGRVVSKISISGIGWNDELGLLTLGKVPANEGLRRELSLNIRGDNATDVELSVGRISTDVLQVSFGEKNVLGQGRLVRVPLIVEVPAGSRTVSLLGGTGNPSAEILIHTTHPKAPKLRMLVRFAIEP